MSTIWSRSVDWSLDPTFDAAFLEEAIEYALGWTLYDHLFVDDFPGVVRNVETRREPDARMTFSALMAAGFALVSTMVERGLLLGGDLESLDQRRTRVVPWEDQAVALEAVRQVYARAWAETCRLPETTFDVVFGSTPKGDALEREIRQRPERSTWRNRC
jgi:hypothetical protein